MTWSEAEYVDCLQAERRGYARVMQRHGGLTPEEARAAALEHYPYEPAEAPFRGLIFHDEAWHWAMLAIHGDQYVVEHPELVDPSPDYDALE
ncbi:hypothetical protein EDD96_6762 [Streptomyces sp. Ag109_G2-6]|uniref:hypothetical protein n=1 Tax=Streptomyces TaxID=1883 RepID=UPI0009A53D37|nr:MULTISPECIES: hypothetical protein [Streptomyces]RPF30174.1 hypothetical protein EDD96_6762 [Streptomyces sp. Ag109_G2-6]